MIEISGMDSRETEACAEVLAIKPYRARQVRHWIFKRLARGFDEMTSLPKDLRARLAGECRFSSLKTADLQVSRDTTRKVLFRLSDGFFIESVLIPERDHWTLCISSQAGCAMGCRFCLTARQGFHRNLSPAEIVDQVLEVKRSMDDPDQLTNLVLMGMGEPLANYENVKKAVGILTADEGLNFSHRKVTLSTCGLVPVMRRLGREMTVNLAVSLNAADPETRDFLMPVNRRYPLPELLAACREFPLPNRRMITFEYILMEGVNDSDRDAERLASLLRGIRAKINLIPLNPHPESPFKPSSMERILQFQEVLIQRRYTAIIRKSKGQDILAACGQLSGQHEEHEARSGSGPDQVLQA